MVNIIGDIAGNWLTLQALLKKMPQDEEIILVGDLIDRGPRSAEVVEWARNTPNVRTILGNHEHMMVDHVLFSSVVYGSYCWSRNGGNATVDSFMDSFRDTGMSLSDAALWMKNLPTHIMLPGRVLISHSFVPQFMSLEDAEELIQSNWINEVDQSIIWARNRPSRRPEWSLQVAGHNGVYFGLKEFTDDAGIFAVCVDDCGHECIGGIHLPSGKLYRQDYID